MKIFLLLPLLLIVCVAAFPQAGVLDSTFDGDGITTTGFDNDDLDMATSIIVQPDGKTLAAGSTQIDGVNTPHYFAIARYNINGTLDSTFDGDGKVITDISPADDVIFDIALQPDGKIIVAGQAHIGAWYDFAVARYLPNGTLDSAFSQDGFVITEVDGYQYSRATCVELQADGSIVAAGLAFLSNPNEFYDDIIDFVMIRYLPDGTPDSSFSTDGIVMTDLGEQDYAYAISIQSDQKIILGGTSGDEDYGGNEFFDIAIARYYPDGSLDNSFSGNGWLKTNADAFFNVVLFTAVQPDGKILAAGRSLPYFPYDAPSDFTIVRYLSDGSPDSTFGNNGIAAIDYNNLHDFGTSLLLQPDGKIIVAGTSIDDWPGDSSNFVMIRLDTQGIIDSSFGINGKVVTDVDPDTTFEIERCAAAALGPDGKILLAGRTVMPFGANVDFVVIRYLNEICMNVNAGFKFTAFNQTVYFFDTSNNATSWLWDFGDGETDISQNPVHTYALAGTYQVCLLASDTCSYDTICQAITIIPTSLSELVPADWHLVVFPNPFLESTTIRFFLEENVNLKIELQDLQGRKIETIAEGNFEAGNHQLHFEKENLNAGIYLLQLSKWIPLGKTNSGMITQKVIIQSP